MNITKHIPNTITSMNLLCGVLGVILTMKGNLNGAFILMIAAAGFDFFDGLAARLLNAKSLIGKELDSLSDLISFGVPADLYSANSCNIFCIKTCEIQHRRPPIRELSRSCNSFFSNDLRISFSNYRQQYLHTIVLYSR